MFYRHFEVSGLSMCFFPSEMIVMFFQRFLSKDSFGCYDSRLDVTVELPVAFRRLLCTEGTATVDIDQSQPPVVGKPRNGLLSVE